MSHIDYLNISQKEFEKILEKYSNDYHNGISSITDEFFDSLTDIYSKRFNKTYSLIGHAVNHKNKVKLPYCMPSLSKVLTENEIYNWLAKWNNEKKFIISDKIDGISILLFIKNKNVQLLTRGDGTEGRDVSYFLPYFDFGKKDIIDKIKNINIAIRGELVLPIKTFEKKYKNRFSNPRNTVSGAIVSKDFEIDIIKDCKFLAYEIYNSSLTDTAKVVPDTAKNRFEDFKILTQIGFNTPFYFEINKNDISYKNLEDYIRKRRTIADYEMDGIVISTTNVFEDKTTKSICENPKDFIAFKIKGDTMEATVEYVEWNISKNGLYKPRIKIHPINLSGVTINYTTGFNAKFIVDNKIGKGSIVVITRSGDVIPYILEVKKPGELVIPKDSVWNESGVELVYDSNDQNINEDIIVSQFVYSFKELGMKNLGKGNIKKLVDAGYNTIFKLINISKNDLLQIEGFKDKSALIILDSLNKLKTDMSMSDWMIASSLFPSFGRKKIDSIINNIPDFLYLNESELLKKLNNIGFNKTADTFIEFLPKFKEFLYQLKRYNIKIVTKNQIVSKEENSSNDYEGVIAVFTGVRDDNLKKIIESSGGKVVSTFSGKVNLVITNNVDGNSSTLIKARENNIKIVDINELK